MCSGWAGCGTRQISPQGVGRNVRLRPLYGCACHPLPANLREGRAGRNRCRSVVTQLAGQGCLPSTVTLRRVTFLKLSYLPFQNRSLLWQFARRDVLGRYRGSVLGLAWSFLTPLLMLGVYTFVFVGVFRASWPGTSKGGGAEFALQVFAGLLVFNLFAEVTSKAPNLIVDQSNLVKKVIFPVELLAWVTVLSGLFHLLISAGTLLLVLLFVRQGLPVTAVALPLVLLPFVPVLLGVTWLLSAVGVFVRDVGNVIAMVVSLIMFMSPVFYSIKTLSPDLQSWMNLNPLTLIIEQVRAVLLLGQWPDWGALGLYGLAALLFAAFAGTFFQLTRKGFADVL
jgi:lipopolysaccharide transport system permease protein